MNDIKNVDYRHFEFTWQRGSVGENGINNIRWPIPENLHIEAKISQISLTQAEL